MSEVRMKLASLLAERFHATWLIALVTSTILRILTLLNLGVNPITIVKVGEAC